MEFLFLSVDFFIFSLVFCDYLENRWEFFDSYKPDGQCVYNFLSKETLEVTFEVLLLPKKNIFFKNTLIKPIPSSLCLKSKIFPILRNKLYNIQ